MIRLDVFCTTGNSTVAKTAETSQVCVGNQMTFLFAKSSHF